MSQVTNEEWTLIRQYFGDLAYEEPHNHQRFLTAIRGIEQAKAGEVEDADEVIAEMDAIIASGDLSNREVLEQYSAGIVSARVACVKLGLRDSADLLVAPGDAGLRMPQPPEDEVRKQANTFASLFRENKQAKAAELPEAEDVAEGHAQLDRRQKVGLMRSWRKPGQFSTAFPKCQPTSVTKSQNDEARQNGGLSVFHPTLYRSSTLRITSA